MQFQISPNKSAVFISLNGETQNKDGWRVPTSRRTKKWNQNIPDTRETVLCWWHHLKSGSQASALDHQPVCLEFPTKKNTHPDHSNIFPYFNRIKWLVRMKMVEELNTCRHICVIETFLKQLIPPLGRKNNMTVLDEGFLTRGGCLYPDVDLT